MEKTEGPRCSSQERGTEKAEREGELEMREEKAQIPERVSHSRAWILKKLFHSIS